MNFMGIDVGTTSVKIGVYDEGLNELLVRSVDYTLDSHGEFVEFDAMRYWEIVRDEIAEIKKTVRVDALSVDTQCETLILTDREGNPVRNAIVWLDNRATAEAEMIREHFGNKRVYEVTGQPEITATWPAAKLLWVKRNEPSVFEKCEKIFLLEDWLLFKLTGRFVSEYTLQSSTIYFDIRKSVWWDEMLDFIGVDKRKLPRLTASAQLIGEYSGIKVVSGAIDQIAGAIGAGVVKRGVVSEMTGTTMVIFMPPIPFPNTMKKASFRVTIITTENIVCFLGLRRREWR